MEIKIKFGNLVQQKRKAIQLSDGSKMTQEKLAEQCGLCSRYISNIENGLVNPGLTSIVALAGFLKIDLNQFIAENPFKSK